MNEKPRAVSSEGLRQAERCVEEQRKTFVKIIAPFKTDVAEPPWS